MAKVKEEKTCSAYVINEFFQEYFRVSSNEADRLMDPYCPCLDDMYLRIYKGEQMAYETDEQRAAIDAFLTRHNVRELVVLG